MPVIKEERSLYFQKQMEENPDKYPKRHGMPWGEDEIQELLIQIARKKTHEQIAEIHERTVGGIIACLKRIIRDYYDEGKPIEKIMKYTGFSQKWIEEIIKNHDAKKNKKELKKKTPIVKSTSKVPNESTTNKETSDNIDMYNRLKHIENLLVKILDKLEKL